ncbi:MAG: nuclear transport factor 2 family protein [Gammaproteobacteria bacterium]
MAVWLEGYKSAWVERDADKAAALFSEDATYLDNPHNEPYKGRAGIHEYWSDVTSDQRGVTFDYEILTTYGNTAVAQWAARFTSVSSGATVKLDGIFLLDFDENGLCSRLREWWHVEVDQPDE